MRRILFLAVLLLSMAQAWAADVDLAAAQAAAQRFLTIQSQASTRPMAKTSPSRLTLLHAEGSTLGKHATVYYVFNYAEGFVIISGDDRARQVLAYGDRPISDMAALPAGMRYWLSCYKQQIEYLQEHPAVRVTVPQLGDPARAAQSVSPMLTANWSQLAPYWNECPVYGTDTCYTGCPATALSMVFHYWKYPRHQTPAAPSYMTPQYGIVLPELPPTTFDWANMLDDYTHGYNDVQAAAVAHLMRYIGQVEEMDYTISGSGAYGKDILRAVKFFEYDQDAQLLFKTDDLGYANYSDAQWAAMMLTELTAGRPIVYCAYDNYTGAGHAFNIDGYDAPSDTYHINWGWNGRGNGNYALNAFSYGEYTFGTGQQMVIGIQPPAGYQDPRLQAFPATIDIESYINRTERATVNIKGTNLTSDVTLTLNDPDGVFGIDKTILPQADAEGGAELTVTYSPIAVGHHTATITCSSTDAPSLTIMLSGTAPLEVYPVVMQPVDESTIDLTSFTAHWTDATPADNVASYTLEVSAKPAFTLLEEADFSDLPQTAPTNQASHATDYLPEGWTFNGSEFNLEGGCVSIRRNGTITTSELNLKGYDKMTIEVTARAYGYYGDGSELNVTTSAGTQEMVFMYAYETQTIVVDCAATEQVVFKAGYYPMIKNIKIYAGDATQSGRLNAAESGDATYRLIEGITGATSYRVRDLEAGGTFLYKVKAHYIDNSESEWSNVEMVTLAAAQHNYEPGDVNHDRLIDVSDVSLLINHILGSAGASACCPVCADLDGNGEIDVSDVSKLIKMILGAN